MNEQAQVNWNDEIGRIEITVENCKLSFGTVVNTIAQVTRTI